MLFMNWGLRLGCARNAAAGVAEATLSVETTSILRIAAALLPILLSGLVGQSWAGTSPEGQGTGEPLTQLSLAQLGNVEVTTASKEPEEVWKTPAAVFLAEGGLQ
jgi:hypothetical protein